MARLSFRCDEGLVRRVDVERGLVPREAWLRRAVEQALGVSAEGERAVPDRSGFANSAPVPAPAEQFEGRLRTAVKHFEPDLRELAAERPSPRRHLRGCKCPVCK